MGGVKKQLKKIPIIYKPYLALVTLKLEIDSKRNPEMQTRKLYKRSTGRELNITSPKAFTEKLQWLKLNKYWYHPLVSRCADKYAVRSYVEEKGCEEILTKLYGIWDKADDIEWSDLPDKFVLKCNHGSGYNIVCENKKLFNKSQAIKKLNHWLHKEYGVKFVEQGIYGNIHRKVIAEEYIETDDGLPPHDYKFFCSQGKVKMLFVAQERINNAAKFDFYYPDWTYINVKNHFETHGRDNPPHKLEMMIHYAEKLSESFPIVRVDLYNEGDRVLFGELTFLHFGGYQPFNPDSFDFEMGQMFPSKEELERWT